MCCRRHDLPQGITSVWRPRVSPTTSPKSAVVTKPTHWPLRRCHHDFAARTQTVGQNSKKMRFARLPPCMSPLHLHELQWNTGVAGRACDNCMTEFAEIYQCKVLLLVHPSRGSG